MPAPANDHTIPSDPRPLIGEPLPLDLLTTRDALDSLISSGADQEKARADLNETLAHGSVRRSLGADGPANRVEIVSSTWMPAWAAAETYLRLLEEAPERISACQRRGCVLHFYDLSRDHTRRWCSVTGCGGRHGNGGRPMV